MKIKLLVSEKRYADIEKELASFGIGIDDNADLVLSEANSYLDCIMGKRDEEIFRIHTDEIIYIESLAHDIVAHTINGEYKLRERLWQLESMLDPQMFLRISNSVIIAKDKVKLIRPALSQKFTLTLADGSLVDVTRSYYYIFKDKYGI